MSFQIIQKCDSRHCAVFCHRQGIQVKEKKIHPRSGEFVQLTMHIINEISIHRNSVQSMRATMLANEKQC